MSLATLGVIFLIQRLQEANAVRFELMLERQVSQQKRIGAREGTRTPTPLLASGPKPGASTNFATLAAREVHFTGI